MPVLKYKDPADGQWKPVPLGNVLDMIRRAGDRMTGPLLVPEATEADQVMPLGQADARYVNVSGDTMGGPLLLRSADSQQGANIEAWGDGSAAVAINPVIGGVVRPEDRFIYLGGVVKAWQFETPLRVEEPVFGNHAATKDYVDGGGGVGGMASFVPQSGNPAPTGNWEGMKVNGTPRTWGGVTADAFGFRVPVAGLYRITGAISVGWTGDGFTCNGSYLADFNTTNTYNPWALAHTTRVIFGFGTPTGISAGIAEQRPTAMPAIEYMNGWMAIELVRRA
jgi:hypothetical protein